VAAGGAPDSLSILASGKRTYSLPLRVIAPGAVLNNPPSFPLQSSLGIEGRVNDTAGAQISSGDLVVAVKEGANCDLFQATAVAGNSVSRGASGWNPNGPMSTLHEEGSYLVNLGAPDHRMFTVVDGSLRQSMLQIAPADGAPSYSTPSEIFPGIVNVQAQYGRDVAPVDGTVDTWDNVTPVTNDDWRRVLAVRVAVVARSGQYEKDVVTSSCPTWAGTQVRIPASPSACASYPNAADEEWKHYRYKVFDTVVPLRNLLWSS
jgi:type IV pilus assembly protein PilW